MHLTAIMQKPLTASAALMLACSLWACGSSSSPFPAAAPAAFAPRPAADPAEPAEIRTTPNPLCFADYIGTTGQLQGLPDPGLGLPTAIDGGAPADPAIAATLPDIVHLRGTQESYNATHYYAVRDGRIYLKANRELTGIDESWREMLLPSCLDGRVSALSVDGTVVLALDGERWIYTLDTASYGPVTSGWTRRWGAFFWTDPGEQLPADVTHWSTSHLSGEDTTYVDSAGREQDVFGILTLYALRADGLRITYMDPWLPSDESREVCGPERGTVAMAGLSGSGSTVMVVSRDGEIYTRLYEFDVSGANSMFFDYSWQDQDDVAVPLFQLPAPDWVHHARVPGAITNRLSLRKLPPDTVHRILRVEGQDAAGHTGYWEKDLTDPAWRFVRTDEALLGERLPLPGPYRYAAEDSTYSGRIENWDAEVADFNPYCSPARLRLHIGEVEPLDLILHTTDGLRQERRARGLNAQPHVYRSAIEVPLAVWNERATLPDPVRDFIERNFGNQRFLTGPVSATPGTLQITRTCWTFHRPTEVPDALLPSAPPDLGIYVAELRSAEEEGRLPAACTP